MRIISGLAKGARLGSVPGQGTRPTGDRVKEALFNILGPQIRDSNFLDLFAGNGGIGLEALSRGAANVIWVERNPVCVKMIKQNQEKTRLQGGRIYRSDVFRVLNQLARSGQTFDYIFLDPPYDKGIISRVLGLLDELPLLKINGIIIAEASKKEDAPRVMSKLCLMRQEGYGDTTLYFYQFKEAIQ